MILDFPCIETTRRLVGGGDSTLRVLVPLPRRLRRAAMLHLERKVALLRATAERPGRAGYGGWVVAPTARGENTSAMNVRRWMRNGIVECRPVMVGRVRRLLYRITPKGRSLLLRLEASLERTGRSLAQM